MFANERSGGIDLDHGEPSAGGCNGVAFSCVSLLSHSLCVQLRLEGAPIDYVRGSTFISYEVCHRSLRYIAGLGSEAGSPSTSPNHVGLASRRGRLCRLPGSNDRLFKPSAAAQLRAQVT
jgi:hypothetical protein